MLSLVLIMEEYGYDVLEGEYDGYDNDFEQDIEPAPFSTMTNEVLRPTIPCLHKIPGGIQDGKVIEIRGSVPDGAKWFAFNLIAGLNENVCDRPFHLSVRLHEKAVVRNSRENRCYMEEEREGPCPFETGKDFKVILKVETDSYKIAVNGEDCWTFLHRLPVDSVKSLFIDGDVKIETIIILPSPYLRPIPGGVQDGKLIEINGSVLHDGNWFEINLSCDQAVICHNRSLHLSARFPEKVVVRNHLENGHWGVEQRDGPFPFKLGAEFTVMILVEAHCYKIAVDGKHCWEFGHRIPLDRVNSILIQGYVNIDEGGVRFIDRFSPYHSYPSDIHPGVEPETNSELIIPGSTLEQ